MPFTQTSRKMYSLGVMTTDQIVTMVRREVIAQGGTFTANAARAIEESTYLTHNGVYYTRQGDVWTADDRAERIARILFPYEATRHGADGTDCHAEHGREGQPCRFCAESRAEWLAKVEEVRAALEATEDSR